MQKHTIQNNLQRNLLQCGRGWDMQQWLFDKTGTDDYLPYCQRIIETYVGKKVGIAGIEDDQLRATDLISEDGNIRVAVRIRDHSNLKYADEFTVRLARPSGAKTEFEKLYNSRDVRYMIYGFKDAAAPGMLIQWTLIDLDVWRTHDLRPDRWPSHHINRDGTTLFCFKYTNYPENLVLARKTATGEVYPCVVMGWGSRC